MEGAGGVFSATLIRKSVARFFATAARKQELCQSTQSRPTMPLRCGFHRRFLLLMIAEYGDILASEGVSPLQGSPFNYSIPQAHEAVLRLLFC